MSNSRSKNVALNVIVGFLSQFGIVLLSFAGRKIFVYFLSVDYLGINGLYGNILSVLSLAELGLGSVVQFYLYKPVAEKNEKMICALMEYLKKLYMAIAGTILLLGLLFIPVLRLVVNSDLPQDELIIYYVIFLLNSVMSYLSAHKVALLSAHQDNRLHKLLLFVTQLILQLTYIVILVFLHNYLIYVSAMLVFTVVNQVLLSVICNKRYPYLLNKEKSFNINKHAILESVKSTFIYKIGATVVNNTDNILISTIVSTAAVGLYSNYFMVVNAIQGFLTIITTSLISGIGNLSADGDKKRMLQVFRSMLLFYHFVAAFGAISFYFLFEELITAWLGKSYVLDRFTVFAIALSFYLTNAISPIWMFRESNGLFSEVKYLLLVTAGCNIVFSIILGKWLGLGGILLATSLARLITQVWYEPRILFSKLFGSSEKVYWIKQIKYVVLTGLCIAVCGGIDQLLPHGLLMMFIKAILFLNICVAIWFWGNIKTEESVELKNMLWNMLIKFVKK